MLLWLLGLASAALVFFCVKVWKAQRYWKEKGIPYDKPIPFFGIMHDVLTRRKSFIECLDEIYRAHPDARYVGYYQFTKPVLLLRDPELIKQICVKDFDAFPEHRALVPEGADPMWNKNLMASNAEKWRGLRPTMSPAFSSAKMKIIFDMMEECSRQFTAYFQSQHSDTLDVELKDIFTRYTNDVIAATTFGVKVDSLREQNNEFYRMGKAFADFDGLVILKFFLYDLFATPMKLLDIRLFPKDASAYFKNFFKQALKHREENNIKRPDMLHLLLQARRSELENQRGKHLDLSDEEVAAQAMIFFLGGFETVATSLCFTVYELAVHQDIQNRLREEVDDAWRKFDGKLSMDEISKLKYLDMVISENLRKNTPMIMVDRQAVRPYTIEPVNEKEKPLRLEAGAQCLYSVWSLHWDPEYFHNPRKFDPERFSDENKHKIKPGTYVPFGVGPRNCIGSRFAMLEMKSLLFHLIRDFEVVPNKKTEYPLELHKDRFTLAPKNGFHLTFKKRQHVN